MQPLHYCQQTLKGQGDMPQIQRGQSLTGHKGIHQRVKNCMEGSACEDKLRELQHAHAGMKTSGKVDSWTPTNTVYVHANIVYSHPTTEHPSSPPSSQVPHSCSAYSACSVGHTIHGITLDCKHPLHSTLHYLFQVEQCPWIPTVLDVTHVHTCYLQHTFRTILPM